ncbi:MAG: hypothetical protein P8Y95_04215 [Gammaproteobacteria bacterium]
MTIIELGALGEFLGVFALVATLLYLSLQVRHAREESEKAVLEARTTGIRDIALGAATSDGLSAALVKADEVVGAALRSFEAELISLGLERQEAYRVQLYYRANWRHDQTQYEHGTPEQRRTLDSRLQAIYSRGVGRLWWNTFGRGGPASVGFVEHVSQLVEEADRQSESQQ